MGAQSTKKTVSLTLTADQVTEARALGLNLSRISDAAIEKAVRAARYERWLAENGPVLEAQDVWSKAQGHPLAEIATGPLAAAMQDAPESDDASV